MQRQLEGWAVAASSQADCMQRQLELVAGFLGDALRGLSRAGDQIRRPTSARLKCAALPAHPACPDSAGRSPACWCPPQEVLTSGRQLPGP